MWDIVKARYGTMYYLPNDTGAGANFGYYGEHSQNEIEFLATLIKPGDTVLDVGANIGGHTLAFASFVGPTGQVLAFEPQTIMYQLLSANVVVNDLTNVKVFGLPLSDQNYLVQIPDISLNEKFNFGGMSILQNYGNEYNILPSLKIDDLKLEKLNLIKADVEGFESRVLVGAHNTIAKHRPLIYLENNRPEQFEDLKLILRHHGYSAYHHNPLTFNRNNYLGKADNPWHGSYEDPNMICFPAEKPREDIINNKWTKTQIL